MAEDTVLRANTGRGSDFAELLRRVRGAGLLERRPAYYTVKVGVTALLLAFGIALFVLLGDTWWQLVTAGYLAVVFTQIGFVGHDAGHQQILRRGKANAVIGILHANVLIGLSYGWWVDKHSRHHAHPNEVGRDPDIGAGALVFTAGDASGRGSLGRRIVRYQAWYFFPLLSLEAANLHVASIRALFDRLGRRGKGGIVEAALLVLHVAGYLALVLLILSPVRAVVFIVLNQALFGVYLGCAFAPNHKGMPNLAEAEAADFLRRQVLTSRNVRGGPVTDWVLGGLNYQIEHHLFPSMPRVNLKHAQPLVRAFCAERGVAYLECGAFASYRQAIGHLNAVGAGAGRSAESAAGQPV